MQWCDEITIVKYHWPFIIIEKSYPIGRLRILTPIGLGIFVDVPLHLSCSNYRKNSWNSYNLTILIRKFLTTTYADDIVTIFQSDPYIWMTFFESDLAWWLCWWHSPNFSKRVINHHLLILLLLENVNSTTKLSLTGMSVTPRNIRIIYFLIKTAAQTQAIFSSSVNLMSTRFTSPLRNRACLWSIAFHYILYSMKIGYTWMQIYIEVWQNVDHVIDPLCW